MQRSVRASLPRLLLFVVVASLSLAQNGSTADGLNAACASNHILVRFKPEARSLVPAASSREQLFALLARLGLPAGVELQETAMARLAREKRKTAFGAAPEELNLDHFFYLRLPPGLSVAECVRRFENHPLLEYAEPDWIGTVAETIPSDPNFADQWHHQNALQPSASMHVRG